MHSEIVIYRVLHKTSSITVSFSEHRKFQEKLILSQALWVNSSKLTLKKLPRIGVLCILKMLSTGCSTKEAISPLFFAKHSEFKE